MLVNYDSGSSKRLYEAVTGDETWISQFDLQIKYNIQFGYLKIKNRQLKVERSKSIGKKMIATFSFLKNCCIASVPLEEQNTITENWYTEICPPVVIKKVEEKRPKTGARGIHLHHDNASAHSVKI